MDEKLAAFARHIEEGGAATQIFLVTSTGIFSGTARPSKAFVESSRTKLATRRPGRPVVERLNDRKRFSLLDDLSAEQRKAGHQTADDVFDPLRGVEAEGGALTLAPAEWFPVAAEGEVLELPAVRVALASVEAWFFVRGKLRQPKQRRTWFWGIWFPSGN